MLSKICRKETLGIIECTCTKNLVGGVGFLVVTPNVLKLFNMLCIISLFKISVWCSYQKENLKDYWCFAYPEDFANIVNVYYTRKKYHVGMNMKKQKIVKKTDKRK